MTLTLQFTPEMKRMWPASSDDYSSAEWVKQTDRAFYVIHQSVTTTLSSLAKSNCPNTANRDT